MPMPFGPRPEGTRGAFIDAMTQNYPVMPELNIPGGGMLPGMMPGMNMQQNYDLFRDMTTINPALELAGGAVAPGAGAALGKVGGMMGRMAGKYGDELAGLFQKGKRAYEGPPQGPMGGGQAALGPDMPLSNMGPDDFLNPDDYARHVDQMGQGPMPPPAQAGPGGLAGQEAASGYPTMPMEPPPSNFMPEQMPPPLGGQPQGQGLQMMGTSQPSLGGMPPEANQMITDAVNSGMSVEQAVEWVMQMYQGMGG